MEIIEDPGYKTIKSPNYNSIFRKEDGYFMRWGKTLKDDPDFAPAPEIADIEISTICSQGCSFCYKGNTATGENMSLETFKKVFHNLPRTLQQIAFGIGDIDGNPELEDILSYCRNNDYNQVVPNITINGSRMTPEYYDMLVKYCGAVAVSRYDPDTCYNAIQELTSRGLKQCNIHMLLSDETYDNCLQTIKEVSRDTRTTHLKAIVFLGLKPKGRAINKAPLKNTEKYRILIAIAQKFKVGIGFDSCSAPTFLKAMENHPNYDQYYTLAEPCESYLFSMYVNTEGKTFPCSFLEKEDFKGIDLTQKINFDEVWNEKTVKDWRENLLATAQSPSCLVKGCRQCPKYDIY